MEGVLSPTDKHSMVSSFLEIAVGQNADTARQFLQKLGAAKKIEKEDEKATSWELEEAIQLFFVGNENGLGATSGSAPSLDDRSSDRTLGGSKRDIVDDNVRQDDSNEVRAPIPVKREVLYDSAIHYGSRMGYPSHEAHSAVPFRNFNEEMKRPGIWESDQGATSMADNARDNLASLYRPPFTLMHTGPFEKAKDSAKFQDKWFLVNVQSTAEFSSHMLNRDTWANEAVAQTIISNFIFWQVNDDTEEGRKVCTYYRLDSIPVVLVIDPITGQKMRSWCGMIQPESLLEDLLPFMDGSPKDHVSLSNKRPRESSSPNKIQDTANEKDEELLHALAASMENMKDAIGVSTTDKDGEEQTPSPKKPTYPLLPEEPKGDRNLLCRVGVRLPDGRRLQRNFLLTDPIQLLWSFCLAQIKEAQTQSFRLTQAIPGALKFLNYESELTFAESGLANSMISVTWE
ncbi:plant UBX domain-containing protein 7-like isoform X3 [Actinidia eriantha]|uniref:plant UBX domain-containing protein 7-like isoform X3 n=1 Tax=Actinidia eriantha TaxID=165200 RepID=UPI0025846483|nr:plant UBX domain-containing protein 7-like isoform X3 [Actinidia eriantha]